MFERKRIWIRLGTALLASTSLITVPMVADTRPPEAHVAAPGLNAADAGWASPSNVEISAGEAGEGGEAGEAGERGQMSDLAQSDPAYLAQLGMMRGHLSVGAELYRMGHVMDSANHTRHPEQELYASLVPALEKRGAPPFEERLKALADRLDNKAAPAEINAAYDAVLSAIARAEGAVAKPSAHDMAQVIHLLVRNAAEEYGEAVAGGRVVEAHEYQDALGFLRVAEGWQEKLAASGADATVLAKIRKQMAVIKPAWPSIMPPEKAALDPSVVHGAAARIETATLSLKD